MVDDDDEVTVQTPQDVARRTLVLWAVELRAEGVPKDESRGIIDNLDLWEYVSPQEKRFLNKETPSARECRQLVWRLESLWVLMWALGYIEDLGWPGNMCDVPKLGGLLGKFEDEPTFVTGAKLRPTEELLDTQDLTMRIHWATRNAYLHQGGTLPEDLDWSGKSAMVPFDMSTSFNVVEERHYALNWLVNYLDPKDWDHVDTST